MDADVWLRALLRKEDEMNVRVEAESARSPTPIARERVVTNVSHTPASYRHIHPSLIDEPLPRVCLRLLVSDAFNGSHRR